MCWRSTDYTDTAYKLLLQDTAPSWLYEVEKGATTVWETWTGIDDEWTPQSISCNHYCYGAICGWLFGGVCGIHLADQTLTIEPTPEQCAGLGKSCLRFPGRAHLSGWQYEGDAGDLHHHPALNLTADVALPDGRKLTCQLGKYT